LNKYVFFLDITGKKSPVIAGVLPLNLCRMNYELARDYGFSGHALAVLRIPGSIGMESFSLNFSIA